MFPASSFLSASVKLLLQSKPAQARQSQEHAAGSLSLVNGIAPSPDGGAEPSLLSASRSSNALLEPKRADATTMKIRLIERLGVEFGISTDDFDSQFAYGMAVRGIVEGIKLQEGGLSMLAEIEEKLGLGRPGMSLDSLIRAILEPGGDDDRTLGATLREQAGEAVDDERAEALNQVRRDDNGLYGFWA